MSFTTQVPFTSVVLPGEEGAQRSLLVNHPVTGEYVVARYIGFSKETNEGNIQTAHFEFQVRVSGETIIVPINRIVGRFPFKAELESFDALMAEKLQAENEAQQDFEERLNKAKAQSIFLMALPRPEKNPVVYPLFNQSDLRVFFLICNILKVPFKPCYEFNRLVVRFLACGSQERFQEDIPRLSSQDELSFEQFSKNYNKFFMGTAMTSRTLRCSKLTVQKVFLAQFEIAKAMKVQAQCALKIPREYFTSAEPEVKLHKGEHDLIPHSLLEKLE
jgi:hypothetical protein